MKVLTNISTDSQRIMCKQCQRTVQKNKESKNKGIF